MAEFDDDRTPFWAIDVAGKRLLGVKKGEKTRPAASLQKKKKIKLWRRVLIPN